MHSMWENYVYCIHIFTFDAKIRMEFITLCVDVVLHLDTYLNSWAGIMGIWLYVVLFLAIFCETGLVVTPFLPGDSLLFAMGALSARENSPIDIIALWILLFCAAVLGNMTNYSIGKWVGPKIFKKETARWLNKKYLWKTHDFYERHGGKTIIISRFLPIFRTFAPFVAGIGTMSYLKFAIYNIIGAFLWVSSFLYLGFKFSALPIVKEKFSLVVLMVIAMSLIPAFIGFMRAKFFRAYK